MGLFSAMTTAISGLNAQSYALENISGNIANSQTLGFKRNDTNFTDLVPDFGGPRQVSGSVAADKKQTISLAGDFLATSFGTDIALQGSGYFVVKKKQLTQNGTLDFGTDLYTRRGDFRQDKSNYLVNGAGYYLSGYSLDPQTGNQNGPLGPIQIQTGLIPASATTSVVYQGNLPVNPSSGLVKPAAYKNLNYQAILPGSPTLPSIKSWGTGATSFVYNGNLPPTPASGTVLPAAYKNLNYQAILPGTPVQGTNKSWGTGATNFIYKGNLPPNPVSPTIASVAAGGTVSANDEATLLTNTIPGGTTTFYNGATPVTLNVLWARTAANTWDAYYESDSAATGTDPKWTSLGNIASFNGTGDLTTTMPITRTLSINGATFTNTPLDFTGTTQTSTVTTGVTPTAFADLKTITAGVEPLFLAQTILGGTTDVLTDTGTTATLNIRWGKTAANTWEAYYRSNSAATGSAAKWTSLGTSFATFDPLGALTTPTPVLRSLTINGAALTNIPINLTGITQNATATTITGPAVFDDVDIINPANEVAFLAQTIPGGTTTFYNGATPVNLQIRWGQTAANTWNAYYLSNSAAAGTQPKWTSLGNIASFNGTGDLTTTMPVTTSLSIDGVSFPNTPLDFTGTKQTGTVTTVVTPTAFADIKTITAGVESSFLAQTILGGTANVLTDTGANATLNIRWGKTAANTWEAYYLSDSAASGSTPKWTSLGAFASFNGLGALTTPTPVLKTLTIDGAALTNIPINLTGLTQNATATTITPPTVFDDVDIINPANEAAFLAQTISGGSLNLYDAQGNSQTLQLRWGKTAANTWNAYFLSDSAATGTQPKWAILENFATFDTSGALLTTTPVTIAPTINGVAFTGVSFNLTGATQFGDTGGAFTATQLTQNGYTAGNAIGLTINDSGRILQSYTNGKSIPIADIEVANFNGDDALNRIDGGTFEETDGSGEALLGLGSANVRSSGVEASNVDIAQEFTKLITTQQAYSANTKVITTAQDLLATTINMVR